jgi:thymidylate synthase
LTRSHEAYLELAWNLAAALTLVAWNAFKYSEEQYYTVQYSTLYVCTGILLTRSHDAYLGLAWNLAAALTLVAWNAFKYSEEQYYTVQYSYSTLYVCTGILLTRSHDAYLGLAWNLAAALTLISWSAGSGILIFSLLKVSFF